jgi:hypothetical protein
MRTSNNNNYYYYNSAYHKKFTDSLSVNPLAKYCCYICLPGKIAASLQLRAVRRHPCTYCLQNVRKTVMTYTTTVCTVKNS